MKAKGMKAKGVRTKGTKGTKGTGTKAKGTKTKGTKTKGTRNGKPQIRRGSRRTGRAPGAAGPKVVTTEQLGAIVEVLNMLIDHADTAGSSAQVGVVVVRDLLMRKGLFTEGEWEAAVGRVEREQATLFAIDPDARRAVEEIRRLLDLGQPNDDPPDEGGEA